MKDYITSERFIWDELLLRAETIVLAARKRISQNKEIPFGLYSWPADTHKDVHGNDISNLVFAALSTNESTRMAQIRDAIRRTNSYAIMIIEPSPNDITFLIESHHGTRCWILPKEVRGDRRWLGEGVRKDDVHSLGLLWKPKKAQA